METVLEILADQAKEILKSKPQTGLYVNMIQATFMILLDIQLKGHSQKNAESFLRTAFQSQLRVVPVFEFVNQSSLEQLQLGGQSRKVKKFIDSRK